MSATSIEWCDLTWNPVRGCTRVSEGCTRCYAETFAARNLPEMRSPTTGNPFAVRTPAGPRWTGSVELIPSMLDKPLTWRKPQKIFVNSMSDLFHESLSHGQINRVFSVMARAPQHTFQVLTKRPARMLEYFAWARVANATVKQWPLPNVWLGVSVEDQATADERIHLLMQTPAAVRFVSYEPALGPVDFDEWLYPKGDDAWDCLRWVIVGGESGPGARPFDIAWARSAVAQCKAAGVPVFVKQLGAMPMLRGRYDDDAVVRDGHLMVTPREDLGGFRVVLGNRKGGDMSEWPHDLRVREFPQVAL